MNHLDQIKKNQKIKYLIFTNLIGELEKFSSGEEFQLMKLNINAIHTYNPPKNLIRDLERLEEMIVLFENGLGKLKRSIFDKTEKLPTK